MEVAMKRGLLPSLFTEGRPRWLILLAAVPLLLMAVLASFSHGHGALAQRVLLISLDSGQTGTLQVLFDLGSGFREQHSLRSKIVRGPQTLRLPLPDKPVTAIRLDPDGDSEPLTFLIENITLGVSASDEGGELQLTDLVALNGIAALQQAQTGGTLVRVQPASNDPQLRLGIEGDRPAYSWAAILLRLAQYSVLFGLSAWLVIKLVRIPSGVPVPALMFGSGILLLVMVFATTTQRPIHPDEIHHVAAAVYYDSHWLPPAATSPEIANSYSRYGASYLNELDVVYIVAAKARKLWSVDGVDEATALRIFNALLFWVLLAIAWMRREAFPAVVVLLLSPQIWYVFSYFNADALPFFLSIVLAVLFAAPSSPVSRYIEDGRGSRLALMIFVVALGLLVVSKKNYLPVVLVTGLMLLVRHLQLNVWGVIVAGLGACLLLLHVVAGDSLQYVLPIANGTVLAGSVCFIVLGALVFRTVVTDRSSRQKLLRICMLLAASLLVALPRVGADLLVSGTPAEKTKLLMAAGETYADPRFKPSTLANAPDDSYPGLQLAGKGVTLSELVGKPYSWWSISWRSFLGGYGYMDIWAPSKLYWLLAAGWIGIALSLAAWGLAQPGGAASFAILCVGSVLVVVSSLMHSWVNDFQPQGRYLFPAVAMMAFYISSQPGLWRTRLFSLSVAICFFGSLASFVGFAIPALVVR